MTLAMSASEVERHPFKMTRYAATNVKYNPESQKTMRTKKYFKLTPTQEDIYKLLNNTEERPMSSTLSPYAPLPAIGNTFIGPSKSNKKNRKEDHKHQVVMETVELKRTKTKNFTRLEANKKPETITKGKSLDLASNHGRHILNVNVLEEKRAKSRNVLLRKEKKLEGVNKKDSIEIPETNENSGDEAMKVSDVDQESRSKPIWLSVDGEDSKDVIHTVNESGDIGVNISSDLSALSCSSDNLETQSIHESEEFIHNCIKDIEKKGASSRPSTQLTPKRVKDEKHFTLVRERTYDLLEPKILKSKQDENESGSDRSVSRGGNGNTIEWSHKVALEQFGPISLEQSTGSIAFGRRLSSSVSDVEDFERSSTSENTSDFVYDINDNSGDELNNQIWQLRHATQRESDSPNPRRRATNTMGTIPRVLELKRSHIDGLPSASRFSKEADSDPEAWGMRTKMMNRLNTPLRLKSGQVSENSVRILDVTPLRLEDTTSISSTRLLGSRGKMSAARIRDVRTPYIEEIGSLDSGVKVRNSRDGSRNIRIWDTKTPSVEEIDSDFNNIHLNSVSKNTNNSRLLATKTPSIEEIDSLEATNVNPRGGMDSSRRSRGWDRQTSSNKKGLRSARSQMQLKSAHRSGGMSMFIDMNTPSIEEIESVDSDVQEKKTDDVRRFTSGVKLRGSTFGASGAGVRQARSWDVKTPSIEEIGSVGNDTSSTRVRGGDGRGWESKTPSIEEMETRDGHDGAEDEQNEKIQKSYWIDL